VIIYMVIERKIESNDLTFEDMMNLYDIKPPLTLDKLKVAKKKLLLLHPDKNKIDTTKHYMHFRGVYEKLVKIYSYIHHETNEDNLKKEVEIDRSFKTFIEKNNIHPVKDKEKYLKHFNEMFENIYLKDDDGHEEWLKTNPDYDKDDLEGSRKKLIEQNALVKIEIEGASLSDVSKYFDVKEAHTNSIIGLDQDKLFNERPKFKTVDEYQRHRQATKGIVLGEKESLKKLEKDEMTQNMKAIDLSYKYMKQEEIIETKKREYVSKYLLLS
jgi:hypothetical protein